MRKSENVTEPETVDGEEIFDGDPFDDEGEAIDEIDYKSITVKCETEESDVVEVTIEGVTYVLDEWLENMFSDGWDIHNKIEWRPGVITFIFIRDREEEGASDV